MYDVLFVILFWILILLVILVGILIIKNNIEDNFIVLVELLGIFVNIFDFIVLLDVLII